MGPFSFVTPTCSADGYGQAGEQLALAATRHHRADIAVIGHDWADERYCSSEFLALKREEDEIDRRDVCCVFFLPYGLGRYRARVNLNMTMFETDRVPDRWAFIMDELATGVIVPSEHCREVFQRQLSVPVQTVPFGTDGNLFTLADREDREGPFVFLMSGLLHYRKGVDFALQALREEFTHGEAVRLVLKTRRGFIDAGQEAGMLADDRVVLIDEDYTPEEMRNLYHAADAFIACSRGEGSGLTPRDAMATGLPTLVTDWGGLAELADGRYTYPIDLDGLEVAPEENSSYGVGVTGGGPIGNFARPSVIALRAAMREVYENRDQALQRGRRAAAWVRDRWTWERCAGRWLSAIERLSEGAPCPG